MKDQNKKKLRKVMLIWPFNMHATKNPELFPIGLGYLMSNLNGNGYKPEILDCSINELHPDEDEFANIITSNAPDLIGISWWSNNTPMVEKTIQVIKKLLPKTVIVVGGPHPSFYGPDLVSSGMVDYVFYGEAEHGFPTLLDFLVDNDFKELKEEELSKVEGLVYQSSDGSIKKTPQSFEFDLDSLKGLNYEYLKLSKYQEKGYSYGGKAIRLNEKTAPMVVTRGCPYKCNFCAAPAMNGRSLRKHTPKFITDEITALYNDHKVRHIAFVDDNFTLNVKWAKKVCLAIIELGLDDLVISTPNGIRLTQMDFELACLMKKAGWRELVLAPETGSPKTILEMDKDLDLNIVPGVVEMIQSAGLKVAAFFILGYPSETMEDLYATQDFIENNNFDEIYLHIFQPLPGTPIFDKLVKSGDIDRTFVPGSYQQVTFKPRVLEKVQVRDMYNKIADRFQERKGLKTSKTHAVVRKFERELYGEAEYKLSQMGN